MTNSESKRLQNYPLIQKRLSNQNLETAITQNQEIYWQRFQVISREHSQWVIQQLNFFSSINKGNNIIDAQIDQLKIYSKILDNNNLLQQFNQNINSPLRLNRIRQMALMNHQLYQLTKNLKKSQSQIKQNWKQVLWDKHQRLILYGEAIFKIAFFLLNILFFYIWIFIRMKSVLKQLIGVLQFNEMSTLYLLCNYIKPDFWIIPIMVLVFSFRLSKTFNNKNKHKKELLQGLCKLWRKTQDPSAKIQPNISYNLSFFYILAKYCGDYLCIAISSSLYILMKNAKIWLDFIIVQKQSSQYISSVSLYNYNSLTLYTYDQYLCPI